MHAVLTLLLVALLAFLCEIWIVPWDKAMALLARQHSFYWASTQRSSFQRSCCLRQLEADWCAFFHNRFQNVDFSHHRTGDMRSVYTIALSGITGVATPSFVGSSISRDMLILYIGLVVTLTALVLSGRSIRFSWKKLCFIGWSVSSTRA